MQRVTWLPLSVMGLKFAHWPTKVHVMYSRFLIDYVTRTRIGQCTNSKPIWQIQEVTLLYLMHVHVQYAYVRYSRYSLSIYNNCYNYTLGLYIIILPTHVDSFELAWPIIIHYLVIIFMYCNWTIVAMFKISKCLLPPTHSRLVYNSEIIFCAYKQLHRGNSWVSQNTTPYSW